MQNTDEAGLLLKSLIKGRRTIHDFRPGQRPDKDIIKSAIDLSRWAPNHRMTEPWHFYLLGPETVEAICLLNRDIVQKKSGAEAAEKKLRRWREVPAWLLVTCDQSSDTLTREEDYAACCCAIQNLSLLLWQEGIGVKWTSGDVIRDPKFYDLAWIDRKQEFVVGLLFYGYPEEVPNASRAPVEQSYIELP